jgi:uncharacterized protein GlcG (DUF336 family)
MPLSLAQANVLIAAAHDHAVANGWKIAVAIVDEALDSPEMLCIRRQKTGMRAPRACPGAACGTWLLR